MELPFTASAAQSLVEQARRFSPPVEHPPEPLDTEMEERQICSDGYRRVSPFQPYFISPAWRRRQRLIRILAAVLAVSVALALPLLIWHLLGVVRF